MKKKVIYVINHFRPGAIPNILHDILPYLQEEFHVDIVSLQEIKDVDLIVKFEKRSVKVYSLGLKKNDFIKAAFKLKKLLFDLKPDIIHSHLGRADIYSSICKPKNSKLVTTFHSVKSNYHAFTRIGYFLTDKRVDARTAVSKSVAHSWYQDGFLKSKSYIIYNPVSIPEELKESHKLKIKQELGIKETDYVITNIGNIRKQKGQIYLVRALRILIEKHPEAKLIIIGRKAEAYNDLMREVKQFGLEKNVFFLGFRKDVTDILSISDIFVFPSMTEGLGISVLEAMAMKVPVVASKIDSISEYINDGVEGLLVKYNEEQEIARKVELFMCSDEYSKELASNAFQMVGRKFKPEIIAKKYISVYNDILLQKINL